VKPVDRFQHGRCEMAPGCPEPAIFRFHQGKGCEKHKPEGVVFAPFLGQQEKFFQRRERVILFGGAVAGGKAGTLHQLIPTPTGWIANGDIKIGDKVLSSSGRPVRVVGLSEVFTDIDCYRLSFNDGTSIEVSEGHEWLTNTDDDRTKMWRRSEEYRSARREKRPSRAKKHVLWPSNVGREFEYKQPPLGSVKTTKDIAETLLTKRGQVNHAIEQHAPLELPEAALPIPPYTLGAWLGDGTTMSGQITGLDPEVFDGVLRDGFELGAYASGRSFHARGLASLLRSAGVLGNKHIPSVYLRASLPQRLALLRGLMDTDGWCEKDGSCKILLSRKELFDGVVELIRTMGIVVRVSTSEKTATNGAPGNRTKCWQATFATGIKVFTLPRKLARQREPQDRWKRRYIVAAENIGPVPMRCIQVANEDGMYLAGEQFIPTHNSLCLMMKFAQILSIEKAKFAAAKRQGKKYISKAWGIYFRRTTPDLKQIKLFSREYFPAFDSAARFNDNDGMWTFPSAGGAVFQFAHMEHEKDRFKYKSNQYVLILFDELTEFTETQYDYMDTRLRTTDPTLEPFLQICAGSNPDGEGLLWVRERFIEVAPPETVVRIETKLRDGRVMSYDQIFIPAKLTDNPLMMASGRYEASLMNKRPEVREALLEGNWYVVSGAYLSNVWNSNLHVCEDHDIPENAMVFRSGDWGIRSPASIGWWYVDQDGGMTLFAHLRTQGLTADKVASKIRDIETRFGYWNDNDDTSKLNFARNPLDSACFAMSGMSGGPSVAKDFQKSGIRWKPSKKGPGSRYQGAAQIVRRLTEMIPAAFEGATSPWERERPMLRFMRSCLSPIKTIPVLRADPADANDVDTKADDHDWDMVCYACLENPVKLPTEEDDFDDDDVLDAPRARKADRLSLGPPIR
jgi:hypothetical protein